MRTILVLALLAAASPASAETFVHVSTDRVASSDAEVTTKELDLVFASEAVVRSAKQCDAPGEYLAWVVFQNGGVTQVEVGGGADRAKEKCIAIALRKGTETSKVRIVATLRIEVAGAVDRPLPPGPRPVPVPLPEPASYTQREIDAAMRTKAEALRACYQRALARAPGTGGKVVTNLRVGPDGRVVQAKIASSTLASDEGTACVLATIQTVVFPAKGASATILYPILFSP